MIFLDHEPLVLQLNLHEAKVNENHETYCNAPIDNSKISKTTVQKASDAKKNILLGVRSNLKSKLYNFVMIKHPIIQMRLINLSFAD